MPRAKTGWGPRSGVMRPGIDPNKYMNIGKIDLATGEMKVLYSQPQASQGSALVTAGGLMFWGDQNRRLRAFDADDGKVLWEVGARRHGHDQHDLLCRERQAVCDGVHRRRPVGHAPARSGSPTRPCRGRCAGTTRSFVFALPEK